MSTTTRRDFIKKKLLGGFLYSAGIPFLPVINFPEPGQFTAKLLKNDGDEINWSEIRKQFTLSENYYYFNTASLGPTTHMVIKQICDNMDYLENMANEGHSMVSVVREKISKFLNAGQDEIAITRNATEGMNIIARSLPLKPGDEVLLTKHEHIGGSAPWLALQKDIGITIKLIDLDLSGKDNLQIIKANLTEKTKAVSISHVTCTTGMRLPVKEIVDLCRSKGIYSCIDGAQAIGMIPIDLAAINPDFYTCSGHKWLMGPKGTGILFINKSVIDACKPLFAGSYSDSEFDLNTLKLEYRKTAHRIEYGTRNTPVSLGLGSAIDFISSIGMENILARGRELADYFRAGLSGNPKVEILTPEDPEYSASIVTIRIKEKDNFSFTKKMLEDEKYVRIRWIYENDLNAIRVSFAIFNNTREIDYLLAALKESTAE